MNCYQECRKMADYLSRDIDISNIDFITRELALYLHLQSIKDVSIDIISIHCIDVYRYILHLK